MIDTFYYDPTRLMLLKTSIILVAVVLLLIPVVLLFTVSLSRTQLLVMILVSIYLFTCALLASARLEPIEILIGIAV